MPKTMLIDAAHREETRVAVVDGRRIEDFDFEAEGRKPLRGNIYLARVTRVEPSLQAAFVEYGGNRHGFLAFSEIHSDYYQIPVADREALRALEAEEAELERALEKIDRDAPIDDEGDPFPQTGALSDTDDEDGDATDAAAASEDDDDEDEGRDRRRRRRSRRGGRRRTSSRTRDDGDDASAASAEDDGASASDDAGSDEDAEEAAAASDDTDDAPVAQDAADDAADDQPTVAVAGSDSDSDDGDDDENGGPRSIAADSSRPPQIDADPDSVSEDAAEPFEATVEAAEAADAETVALDAEDDDADEDGETDIVEARGDDADISDDDASDDDDAEDEQSTGLAEDDDDDAEETLSAEEIDRIEKRYAEIRRERARILRNYKIQEVVKRRQILLVQVVKEERGNKGAALTTYLSLAGRYCVLMPNTARGGGISRKIASSSDRKRLRRVVEDLAVPPGMALIVRTAGAKRTKIEIKRDYDYLLRIWDSVRELTLKSVAPCLIYEEASLVKRAIRDLYDKDIDRVLVEGEDGYREAKDFMRMLMPSHARNVQRYTGDRPLFVSQGVEKQLDEVYTPTVKLKSGGYLVIHVTEALVAVDVNSGKATRERNIEQTALKTNIEAAHELARQARLRDLAGLIVIDFIDMEENRHNRQVEKALKEALAGDRARIQMGRISSFGLLEMSRQRRRSGIVDGTTQTCSVCEGMGVVRAPDTAAVRILRSVEAEAAAGNAATLVVRTATETALHMLNAHRARLQRIEDEYGVTVEVTAVTNLHGDQFEIEKRGSAPERPRRAAPITADQPEGYEDDDEPVAENIQEQPVAARAERAETSDDETSEDDRPRRRRRRRRRKSEDDGAEENAEAAATDASDASNDDSADEASSDDESDDETRADGDDGEDGDRPRKRRRRGRRGGRRNRKSDDETGATDGESDDLAADAETSDAAETSAEGSDAAEPVAAEATLAEAEPAAEEPVAEEPETKAAEPAPAINGGAAPEVAARETDAEDDTAQRPLENTELKGPPKDGWWSRALRGKF